jgi:carboxymethylenebutenolidase
MSYRFRGSSRPRAATRDASPALRCDGIDAAGWYHGADTENIWARSMGFMCPSHAYSRGGFISKAAQAKIKGALAKKPNATVYSYPG